MLFSLFSNPFFAQMDIGVGSFVVSFAFTYRGNKPFKEKLLAVVPMFILGFIRLAMVKASDYQVC